MKCTSLNGFLFLVISVISVLQIPENETDWLNWLVCRDLLLILWLSSLLARTAGILLVAILTWSSYLRYLLRRHTEKNSIIAISLERYRHSTIKARMRTNRGTTSVLGYIYRSLCWVDAAIFLIFLLCIIISLTATGEGLFTRILDIISKSHNAEQMVLTLFLLLSINMSLFMYFELRELPGYSYP